ncbi:master DNA invertase Mpi family serine-type recombinase [Candidatus Tisiphia endosymbiont of Sialis lutaria]|uniref:master DNA invertase Mpi family serine-type recombinase n=1 Tax=Candidatus Tisiphia endosymbiont of Sialis lutaria TaxID=2029164 RepID=UPI00312CAAE6
MVYSNLYKKYMIYAYVRVSTDTQTVTNQKYEILQFIDEKKIHIGQWVEESISGTKKVNERKLGTLLDNMVANDLLIVTELSRLGRNLMEVMSFLHQCMERNIKVFTTKERYELGNNINSKVLAFAFSLSAEIERNMISQRTKEALARKKSEGIKLGRPKGSLSKYTKLTGKELTIIELLSKDISISAIAIIFGVHRLTANAFIKNNKLLNKT